MGEIKLPESNRYARFQPGERVQIKIYSNRAYEKKHIATEYGVIHSVLRMRAYVRLDDGKLVTRKIEDMEKIEL